MRILPKAYPKAQGLVPAQQEKSYIRTATKPVLVVAALRNPNPMPHDAPMPNRVDTPLDKQRKLRARFGTVVKTLQLRKTF